MRVLTGEHARITREHIVDGDNVRALRDLYENNEWEKLATHDIYRHFTDSSTYEQSPLIPADGPHRFSDYELGSDEYGPFYLQYLYQYTQNANVAPLGWGGFNKVLDEDGSVTGVAGRFYYYRSALGTIADQRIKAAQDKMAEAEAYMFSLIKLYTGIGFTSDTLDFFKELIIGIGQITFIQNLDEGVSPKWYALVELVKNKNLMRDILTAAATCESISVKQIVNFDVTQSAKQFNICGQEFNWTGWYEAI